MAQLDALTEKLKVLADKFNVFPHVNDLVVLGGLIGLSYIGIAVTNVSPKGGYWYWVVMVPVFAVIILLTQWARLRGQDVEWSKILREQLFHWIGLFIAIQLQYLLVRTGRINYEAAGLANMVLLTFGVFLEGVYLDWRFYLVGLFLALGLVLAILVETYLWLILLVFAVVTVTLGWYLIKFRSAPSSTQT